ncbi:MAG TPA: carbon-nitrogen hydrolase family protein [Candidatus Bathyarchaeia archaeon]|nr:carbon-nitrogen hydrolase family protein [Candidatus Bathyarchaeia archaeon]
MRSRIKVAAAQIIVNDNPKANVEKIVKFIDKAAKANCDLICFPESSIIHHVKDASSPAPFLGIVQRQCRKRMIWCIIGSLERGVSGVHNFAYLIDRNGKLVYRYAKVHLYKDELKQKVKPGRISRVIRTELGRLGIIICFDFAYPEFVHRFSLHNVEVIFCLSFMVDYRGWEGLIRAIPLVRAFENTAFYVHSDAVTRNHETAAMSFISSPQRILASLEKREGLIMSTLDLERLRTLKKRFMVLRS